MAVAHQATTAILRGEMGMGRESFGNFGLNRLRQQGTRAVAQRLGQRIGDVARLAQGDDIILFHGVSILQWMLHRLSPSLIRRLPFPAHHQLSRIAPKNER
jgi:hypothetical protein